VSPDHSRTKEAGVSKRKQAISKFLSDAEGGCPDAQYDVGLMYATGHGGPQDNVLAHMWFNIAALSGVAWAREERKSLSIDMTAAEIATAQRMARERTAQLAA
jgi:TPR repeat protein